MFFKTAVLRNYQSNHLQFSCIENQLSL